MRCIRRAFSSIAQSCRKRNHLPFDLERTPSVIMCIKAPLVRFFLQNDQSSSLIFSFSMSDMKKADLFSACILPPYQIRSIHTNIDTIAAMCSVPMICSGNIRIKIGRIVKMIAQMGKPIAPVMIAATRVIRYISRPR